ncbi:MAG: muconolactone Delta-isomerase family protein [Candidatus Velthaea sp.]
MAQFLALAKRNYERFAEADLAPLLEPEAERARELYAAGAFRQMWGRGDVPGAAIVIEAASLDEARAAIASLPLVQKDMLTVDIIPLTPYRGFGPRR